MKPKLSIIIPCYNCQSTLKEAVQSCFIQGLNDFEIVMVDDASTDNTKDIMRELSNKYPEIKLFYHERNKGGGATRNFAIRNTSADYIFCLDSDDILPENTLSNMLAYLLEKKCDGVGIHKSIKFNGTNPKDVEVIHIFGYAGNRVPFKSLIEKRGMDMNPLYSTFMHTRKAFDITGGYAEDHGFDTQSFAWKFLANGLIAYTCPEVSYLHRINFHKSYYIREAEGGRVNLNWFKIFDEFLFLFSDKAKDKILSFKFNDYTRNIYDSLKKVEPLFIENLEEHTTPYVKDAKIKEMNSKAELEKTAFDLYWLGSELFRRKDFVNAKKELLHAKAKGLNYPIIYEKLNLCEKFCQGMDIEEEIKKADLNKQNKIPTWKYHLKFLRSKARKAINSFRSLWAHIEVRRNSPRFLSLSIYFLVYRLLKKIKFGFTVQKYDNGPIDVLIVTTSKDYLLLEMYLTALKNNLSQKINKIFLVSSPKDDLMNFCKTHSINFIDENRVLGYGKDSIQYNVDGIDRSGWMLQQLIKLYGDTIVEKENFLSVCSDTILINKNSFLEDGKFVFFENEEWHEPYFKNFKKIFGYDTKNKMSFTSHMMIFNAKKLKLMREELEQKNKMTWDKAYMSTIDDTELSCISDYDTYANWVLYNFPEETVIKILYNTALKRSLLADFKELIPELKKKYNTVSFHSYVKES